LNGLTKFPEDVTVGVGIYGLSLRLESGEAVEREVTAWFRQQPREFYAAGFQGLVKHWDKCLTVHRDYVEK
jgi:hypothetical protein